MRVHPSDRIRAELERESLLVGSVDLSRNPEGWVANVLLNPGLIRARGEQQGLADKSVSAASCSPRIRSLIASAVERVNARLPGDDRVVAHMIDTSPGRAR